MKPDRLEQQMIETARHFPYPAYPLASARPTLRLRALRLALTVIAIFAVPFVLIQIGAVTVQVRPATDLPDRLVDMIGKTSWQDAAQAVEFALKKPASLPDPDAVYLQNPETVIFVWLEAGDGQGIALYQMAGDEFTIRKQAEQVTTTLVNGDLALWVDLPHSIQFQRNGESIDEEVYLVEGSVLIWVEDGITYRLETGSDLQTARIMAESLVEMGTGSD